MFAVAGFIFFVVAAILKLVGSHANVMSWLIIIGGALTAANCAWGWAGPRFHRGT